LRWLIRLAERWARAPVPKVSITSATSSEPASESGCRYPKEPRTSTCSDLIIRTAMSASWISRSVATPLRMRAAYGEWRWAVTCRGSSSRLIAVRMPGL
jgi:hypothetical protein